MEIRYVWNLFIYILSALSLRVLADLSSEDESCEDSNSSDYDTLCQQYLQLTRCHSNGRGPVCGSNGITYKSEYHLARAACPRGRRNPRLSVQYGGFCRPVTRPPALIPPVRPRPPPRDPCDFRCSRIGPVVCGSNGIVYWSECHLRLWNCDHNLKVTVLNVGLCILKPRPTWGPRLTEPAKAATTLPTTTVTTRMRTTAAAATAAATTVRPTTFSATIPTTHAMTTVSTTSPPSTTPVPTTVVTTIPATTQGVATTLPLDISTARLPPEFGGNNTPQPGRGDTPCNDNCPDGPADGSLTVCGTDGNTYETECLLLVQQCRVDRNLEVAALGPCPMARINCPPIAICPKEYMPICGTGPGGINVTYPSLCHFQVDACHARDKTRKVYMAAECPQDSKDSCPTCTPEVGMVCGTDNVTYSSDCALNEIACRKNITGLTVAYAGSCNNHECPDVCINVVDPVCATNGKTYISLCALSVEACKNPANPFTVAYRGRCAGDFCQVECQDVYEPLCDNKGTTYQNACKLWIAICEDPRLTEKMDQDGCNLAIP